MSEFQFLLNIFSNKYTITDMCCRDIRKPISFNIKELNIEFRCTYMLTNLSLKNAAHEYTDIEKLDTLDYDSQVRTPNTFLSYQERLYCEMDILCVYQIVKHFMEETYKHLALFPLTSTGMVRVEFKKNVDYWYIKEQQMLVPEMQIYMRLWACFSGGYTHTNILNSCRVWENVHSYDIASSYPFTMCCEKLPSEPFIKCPNKYFNTNRNMAYIAHIRYTGIKHKLYNHYLQVSKCFDVKGELVTDNGRVSSCNGSVDIWLTNIDHDLIMKCYHIEDYEVIECYSSYMQYLDERIIKFILSLYSSKTTLKGIKEKEVIYKRDKSMLNSLYGMAVTNPLKQSSNFEDGEWERSALTEEFIKDKLAEMRDSYSTLMYYAQGVFITALSRKHLLECVYQIDKDVIYMDTDSIKFKGDHSDIFKAYNKNVDKMYQKVCNRYPSIKISDFKPIDSKGIAHPLGYYEYEGCYEEMLSIGAKKYVVREDGKLKMTLSGVAKSGVVALNNDIRNFKKGLVFDYKTSGKLTHAYIDDQPDIEVDGYKSTLKYGIVLYPTTYTIGITDMYEWLCEQMYIKEAEDAQKQIR